MSSALVRQALAFVDQEDSGRKQRRAAARAHAQGAPGQGHRHLFKRRNKKLNKESRKTKEELVEENIKKLLVLSVPPADTQLTEKLVERAVKGKPLADKPKEKKDDGKSILFPEESFDAFEEEHFCS